MSYEQSVLGKRESNYDFLLSTRDKPFKKRVLRASQNGFLDGNFIPIDHIGLVLCGMDCKSGYTLSVT